MLESVIQLLRQMANQQSNTELSGWYEPLSIVAHDSKVELYNTHLFWRTVLQNDVNALNEIMTLHGRKNLLFYC